MAAPGFLQSETKYKRKVKVIPGNFTGKATRCKLYFKRTYDAYFFASLLILTSVILSINSSSVEAMPGFSRQTVLTCSKCHIQSFGPNLTPFGRDFKLGGYTLGRGAGTNAKLPALSGMIMGSFTNTQKDQTVQSPDQPEAVLLPGLTGLAPMVGLLVRSTVTRLERIPI
jgi:hypothetical protein